jgi:hypothetical protein
MSVATQLKGSEEKSGKRLLQKPPAHTGLSATLGTSYPLPVLGLVTASEDTAMNNIIYIIGLVVVVLAVLSFFGLRG